jgi:hypothetical protein
MDIEMYILGEEERRSNPCEEARRHREVRAPVFHDYRFT